MNPAAANPLSGFQVEREHIHTIGQGLQRPECILAERDGTLWAADARGGVTRIAADGTVTPDDMGRAHGKLAPWVASITFGGPELRTVYLGSLLGTTIPYFRSPVPGLPMVHWNERY